MANRPNILLILNDDMGYSDLGCYGGEIDTPNLDRLAARGSRFTQFYNTARCSPSRASLLTGLHPHQCGIGVLTDDTGPEGYVDDLNRHCVTIAEVLGSAGYRTYMSGKWHMSRELETPSDSWPNQRGFEEFFGTIPGAGSYFHPKSFIRNNKHIEQEAVDDDSFYYTDAISDQAVDYIKQQAESDEPFFLYTAYTAPHWPLQARDSDIAKYKGRFDVGWDELRRRRLDRLRESGVLAQGWDLSQRDPAQPAWEEARDKEWQARRMEVYAAQITVMDEGIGRVISALEETAQMDDTVVIFLADNGGCAEELSSGWLANRPEPFFYRGKARNGEPVRFGNSPDIEPGSEYTYTSYGVPWANLSNTPFRMYKHWTHEGGIATPLIVNWPAGLKSEHGALHHDPAQLPDIMATVLDITGAAYPEEYNGNEIAPMEGESLLPVLQGGDYDRKPLFWEHEGNAAMRDGRWKLVKNFTGVSSATPGFDPPGRRGEWELYDMEADRTELHDLAETEPNRVESMAAEYKMWAARCGVKDREKILANPATTT
jgi:arylsulfatase A-like enzyme